MAEKLLHVKGIIIETVKIKKQLALYHKFNNKSVHLYEIITRFAIIGFKR